MFGSILKSANKPKVSVKIQVLATVTAIAATVAVPQLLHYVGAVSGLGTSLGEIFLPMHLPIIAVGLLAGPAAGAVAGILGPVVSFALSSMPTAVILPFMMCELFGYGLCAGLLRNVKMPVLLKVVIIQLAGRILRTLAIVLAVYAFNNTALTVASVWMSAEKGLIGIILQLAIIPLAIYRIERIKKNEQ